MFSMKLHNNIIMDLKFLNRILNQREEDRETEPIQILSQLDLQILYDMAGNRVTVKALITRRFEQQRLGVKRLRR